MLIKRSPGAQSEALRSLLSSKTLKKKKKKDSSFTITSDKEKAANPYV